MLPELGLSEILVIALVGVLFLKPEDLPGMMHKAGVLWVQLRANGLGILKGLGEKR